MRNEQIPKDFKKWIFLSLTLFSIILLLFGTFRLGQIHLCKRNNMELLLEPEVKCATKEEIKSIENPYWWLNETENSKMYLPPLR